MIPLTVILSKIETVFVNSTDAVSLSGAALTFLMAVFIFLVGFSAVFSRFVERVFLLIYVVAFNPLMSN